jgi:deoxyribose-phosphate aldolase
MSGISIAKSLELHLLQPLVTREEVRGACRRAGDAHLAAVCVWPVHVATAAEVLAGSDTRVRAAIGFPYGQDVASIKRAACDAALAAGAHELAIMLDHSSLGPDDDPRVLRDELDELLGHAWWSALRASRGRADVTIVLESTMLDLDRLRPVLEQLHESSAGFVQTGSGHQSRAVTEQHVRSLREHLPSDIAIIAVGGIATLADAEATINAGAVRVGSASAVGILEQEQHERAARQSAD